MKRTKVLVRFSSEYFTIDVEDTFDDPFMEACTRAIEFKYKTADKLSAPPCIVACLDRKGAKTHVYNTYNVLINAGLHKFAETLRVKFMNSSGIDLQKEPLKSK
jgi:hypothetical protein